MEQVITEIICDLCFKIDNERNVEITFSDVIKIGDAEGKLDLCADHATVTQTLGELKSIIEKYGNPVIMRRGPGRPKWSGKASDAALSPDEQATEIRCPLCDTGPMANRRSLGNHAKVQHGMKISEVDQWARDHGLRTTTFGGYVPKSVERISVPAESDICGDDRKSGAGLRANKYSKHPGWQDQHSLINGRVPVKA
jgi:hypothetical protein